MPVQLGEPQITISLPNVGETLGDRFSVFGTCTEIAPGKNLTITVKVMDGQIEVTRSNANINQQKKTYEAAFHLPGLNVQGNGKVVVTCSGMNGIASHDGLTISPQGTVTITAPAPGATIASWTPPVFARGQVSGCANKTFYLRLTNSGEDLIKPAKEWTITGDGAWEQDLTALLLQAGPLPVLTGTYELHVSVWDGMTESVRMSSGFFTVTGTG